MFHHHEPRRGGGVIERYVLIKNVYGLGWLGVPKKLCLEPIRQRFSFYIIVISKYFVSISYSQIYLFLILTKKTPFLDIIRVVAK